jgi:hypothetical protein
VHSVCLKIVQDEKQPGKFSVVYDNQSPLWSELTEKEAWSFKSVCERMYNVGFRQAAARMLVEIYRIDECIKTSSPSTDAQSK